MSEQDEHQHEDGTAQARSLRVEEDQQQPEDAEFEGGAKDGAQPDPD